MKNYLFISSLLLLSLSYLVTSRPQVNPILNSTYFIAQGEYYSNGLYYFGQGQYYNSSTGYVSPSTTPLNCQGYPSFTLSVVPYCIILQYNQDTELYNYSFAFVDPELKKITSQYEIGTFPVSTTFNLEETDRYLLFEFIGQLDEQYNVTILPFDLSTNSFTCPKYNITSKSGFQSAYFNGDLIVYSYLNQGHNAFFMSESCSGNVSSSTKGPNLYEEVNIFGFNNSQVLVNYYIYQLNDEDYFYIEPAVYDSFNQLRFGTKMNVTNFGKYNDTHTFINYIKKNIQTFGLFVISPSLEFIEVLSFNFGFNVPILASPIYGTSDVLIILGPSEAVLTLDLSQNKITQILTESTPIFLSNGSIVNITQYGYFIQSPGEPFYFIQAPFSNALYNSYQDPTDYNQTYTLFVPSTTYNYYSTCLLTHFNSSSSVITQTTFPNCPLTLATGNPISIKDVKTASDGTLYVCYRDAYGSLYVVNTAGSLGPYKTFNVYTIVQVSLNLTNGTASFAGTLLTNFVLGRFEISSGKILQVINIAGGTYYNLAEKVTDRYFMLAFGGTSALYSIYDMNSFNKTYHVTSDFGISFYNAGSLLIYGFSEENPYNFSGLVYATDSGIYAVNSAGQTLMIAPGEITQIYDIAPLNETAFLATEYVDEYMVYQVMFDILSWGSKGSAKFIEEIAAY